MQPTKKEKLLITQKEAAEILSVSVLHVGFLEELRRRGVITQGNIINN